MKNFLLFLVMGLAFAQSATSAGIDVTQFTVTAQVNGSCTVNAIWLESVIDHTSDAICYDGTPVQVYVEHAVMQNNANQRVVLADNRGTIPDGGVASCGAETNVNSGSDTWAAASFLALDARVGMAANDARLTVVSTCF